jgi:hypothetical protein
MLKKTGWKTTEFNAKQGVLSTNDENNLENS